MRKVIFLMLLVIAAGAVYTVAADDHASTCPKNTMFDGQVVTYASMYSYEYTGSDGVKKTQYMCNFNMSEGQTSLKAEDAWLAPKDRSTVWFKKEVTVVAAYYRDDAGNLGLRDDFTSYKANVMEVGFPVSLDELGLNKTAFLDVVEAYCGTECLTFPLSAGREAAYRMAAVKFRIYLKLSNGTFVEFMFSPVLSPKPECHVRGLHFAMDGSNQMLYIHITDRDELEKVSVWLVNDKKVVNIDLMPYIADRYDYQQQEFSTNGFGALTSDKLVDVFNSEDKKIGQATPCTID